MKRFFTAVLVLLLAAIAAIIMLVPLLDSVGLAVMDFIGIMQEHIGYAAIAAVIVGLSLWLFAVQFKGSPGPQIPRSVVLQVEDGEVRIALTAIETLVKQASDQIKGVREVQPSFFTRNEGLGVYLKVIVTSEGSIPELSSQLQKVVRDHILRIAGVNIEEVKVLVENVSIGARNRVELR